MATVTTISANDQPLLTYSIRSQVNHLATIVRNHEREWNDPLSEKLKKWSGQLFAIILDVNLSIEEKKKLGQAKIDELSKQLLIDPLTRKILQDPVLERKWTWEREMHTWYFNHTLPPRSPFDKQPMIPNPKTHDFAQKMVDWLKCFKIKREIADEKQQENGYDIAPHAQPISINPYVVMTFAAIAVSQRKNEEMRMALANASVEEGEKIKTAREVHGEKLRIIAAKNEAHEEENRENLEAVIASMQNQIRMREEQMAKQEQLHIAEMEAALRLMESQDQSNSQTAEAMMKQLDQMKKDHKQNTDLLKKQIQELQEKIAEVVQKFNGARQLDGERAQIHEQIIDAQRCQASQAYERISNLHSNLSQKESTIVQLTQQVAALNQSLQYAHQRINNMPAPDDDNCTIM